eukprot:GILJ01005795.1.p1 GENE.GILJ01005795.1~~GILJ01005795.1.p1  ORF type:complete len:315 (-),score=56.52 GILJ01005795.1:121-1065(-)
MADALTARKAKTRKGKKVLLNKAPKVIENVKNSLLLKGNKTNDLVTSVLRDFYQLKNPDAKFFYKRHHATLPFEDASSVEFMCQKNDCSLFTFGSHNKKRPNNIIFGRLFDHHILDMVEFAVDNYKGLGDFKASQNMLGSKPCFVFQGDLFEVKEEYVKIKNLFLDYFRGKIVELVNLQGIDHVVAVTALPDGKILFRHYFVHFKKSGTKLPRVELEETGPAVDFTVRRSKFASNELMREATKQPKELTKKLPKNVETNVFGERLGKIHMDAPSLSTLKQKKMKGLREPKRKRPMSDTGDAARNGEEDDEEEDS